MSRITRSSNRKDCTVKIVEQEIIKRKFIEETCAICMDNIRHCIALDTCLHEFCLDCICNWLLKAVSCPQCKQIPHVLLYKIQNDSFTSGIRLDKKFEEEWLKHNLIVDFFSNRTYYIKKLKKLLISFLKNFKLTIQCQRIFVYFCNMKTTLFKRYQIPWNPDNLTIDPSHKIWHWLSIELSVFFESSTVKKSISNFQIKVFNYRDLVKELSALLPDRFSSLFIAEMNTFISFFDSCDNYYYLLDARLVSCDISGMKSWVFDKGRVNFSFLSKVLTGKIFQLENQNVGNDSLMTIFEISHIESLVKILISTEGSVGKDEVILNLFSFINLRIRRSMSESFHKDIQYKNCYQLNETYKYIYLSYLQDELSKLSQIENSTSSVKPTEEFATIFTSKNQIEDSIDLTDD